ncbi:hypothetical protein BDW60DRAFT_216758 [Aspergillus nidulans var. acristatus]
MAEPRLKKRLLCMKVAHYRQPDHASCAAKLHAKNGIEGYSIVFTPKSFRDSTSELNTMRRKPGPFIRGEGAEISICWVETYVRDVKLVNLDDAGKYTFPAFKHMNRAP